MDMDKEEKVTLEIQDAETGEFHPTAHSGPIQLLPEDALPNIATSQKESSPFPAAAVKEILAPNCSTDKERRNAYLFRKSPSDKNTNLLISLHGAGDSHRNFDKLASTMDLPQTCSLAIHAVEFETLPLGLGHSWFQEMDYNTGSPLDKRDPRRQASLHVAAEKFCKLLTVLTKDWIVPERIFFLGFGAGATVAMETCKMWCDRFGPALGGAICVAGGCESAAIEWTDEQSKRLTDVLVMTGANNPSFSPAALDKARSLYDKTGKACFFHIEGGKGMGMLSSPIEMRVVMEFFSKRLVRVSTMAD
jgi:predicted esterase